MLIRLLPTGRAQQCVRSGRHREEPSSVVILGCCGHRGETFHPLRSNLILYHCVLRPCDVHPLGKCDMECSNVWLVGSHLWPLPRPSTPYAWVESSLTPSPVNTALLEHRHVYSIAYCLQLLLCSNGKVELLRQRPHSLQR